MNNAYNDLMNRKNEIMKKSVGLDYSKYEFDGIGFDFEMMMNDHGYDIDSIREIQSKNMVGNTPLVELRNLRSVTIKRNSNNENVERAFIILVDEKITLVEKKSQYQSNKKKRLMTLFFICLLKRKVWLCYECVRIFFFNFY